MWWWLEKIEETGTAVTYGYGVATQNTTGRIRINKTDNSVTRLELADGDYEALYQVFYRLVRHIIAKAGYPEVRSIATG